MCVEIVIKFSTKCLQFQLSFICLLHFDYIEKPEHDKLAVKNGKKNKSNSITVTAAIKKTRFQLSDVSCAT